MLCRSVEGTGSGACGPRLNRVINVNIRLALGAKGKFHSSPAGQRVADIITRLIKHYNCKSTEICRVASAALRLSPPDASLTLSLSLSACSRNTRCNSRRRPETWRSGMWSEQRAKKGVEGRNVEGVWKNGIWCIDFGNVEVNWIGSNFVIEFGMRLMRWVWWRACIEIEIKVWVMKLNGIICVYVWKNKRNDFKGWRKLLHKTGRKTLKYRIIFKLD